MTDERNKDQEQRDHRDSAVKPDSETLHTTDPQESMKGPISSTIKNTGDAFESHENKEAATRKRDENL